MGTGRNQQQQDFLAGIEALAGEVRDGAEETEAARRVPDALCAKLRAAGVLRMMVPERLGGLGLDFPATMAVLTRMARADGAVGWTLMIWCESPQLLALLPGSTFESLYAGGPEVLIAGAFAPKGVAAPKQGGLTASGQWGFASGCQHADLLFGNCVIAGPDASSAPQLRCVVLPRAQWRILDTWHTSGLRGTGSHDIAIADAFVPDAYTFDLFGGTPCVEDDPAFAAPLMQFSLHIGAVALGIAQGALDDVLALAATGKTRLYGRVPMSRSELFQSRLGRSAAGLRAAEAYLMREARDFRDGAVSGTLESALSNQILQTVTWVSETCVEIVDSCYRAGGGSAIYSGSPLQRRLRDIHTLAQHASVQEGVFANSGAGLLGITQGLAL